MENEQKILESIKNLGLSEKSIKIYLAVLSSGKISVSDISKKSGVKRATIYEYLEELLNKNLIKKSLNGKRTLYSPENPENIAKEFEKRRQAFLDSLPILQGKYKEITHKPNVQFYENKDGVGKIFLEISESWQPIHAFFSPEKFFQIFPDTFSKKFLDNVQERDNKLKDLILHTKVSKQRVADVNKNNNGYHKAKLMPKDFNSSVDILVTGDKVALVSFEYLMGILIENPEIASFFKSTHNFFWKNLK